MSTTADLGPPHNVSRAVVADSPDAAASRLQIEVDQRGCAVIVHARGELDAYTMPIWRRVTREASAQATPPGPVIVDISRLDFISCGALVALALDADVCRARRINLIVVSRASTVHRIVAATDLDARLPIHSSTESALLATAAENCPAAACGRGGTR
ncbi:MAG: anti-sigma factor antagonist [Mycobacterium sp.]